MIEPPPVSIMRGIAALLANTIVLRLTVITRSQSSSLTSTTVPRCEMPTLLSRISRRPYWSIAASTMR